MTRFCYTRNTKQIPKWTHCQHAETNCFGGCSFLAGDKKIMACYKPEWFLDMLNTLIEMLCTESVTRRLTDIKCETLITISPGSEGHI